MFKLALSVCLFSFSVQGVADVPNFTKLVEEIKPSVVNIRATRESNRSKKESGYDNQDIPEALKRFLREPYRRSPRPSAGSGFIIGEEGYILTNNHVVDGADEIIVALSDRRESVADLVGYDAFSVLALLKIKETNLPAAKLAQY
ncbi:MAG: trypsin-like peptidase domain-containing protein, partial [Pseudomonadota bacterium]|nr:trypsin-like peptidase domain-containing protein [Pseudomonadota bacterium]